MTINSGTRLNHYEILSRIGAGGMGEVYLAEDTDLERQAALKVLRLEINDDKERVRHFVQEAEAAAALNPPNINDLARRSREDSGFRACATRPAKE
ncbi:MAG: hypothetical protein WAU45_17865 [Blastocatellia bacterium]